jgi:hypothetical protein
MNFYYSTDGTEVLGPHSLDELLAHYRSGALPDSTQICAEGQQEWQSIASLAPPQRQPQPQPQHQPPPQPQQTIQARVDKTVTAATDRLPKFLGDEQDSAVVQKVHARALELCTQGEDIKYIAVQKKPIVTIAPDAVLLTNKRVIIFRHKLIGMSFEDFPWRDVDDIHVKEGLLGATFSVQTVGGKRVEVDSLPKAQARKLYQFGQEMEEQVHHQRRQRDLEDKRAAAGGIVLGAGGLHGAAPTEDPMQKLQQLKGLLDQGLISQQEYDTKKADILSRF